MAAFSYQQQHHHSSFLLDSLNNFLPNTTTTTNMVDTNFFSQFYPYYSHEIISPIHESSSLVDDDGDHHHSSMVAASGTTFSTDNENSVTKKQTTDESSDNTNEQVTQTVTHMDNNNKKKRKSPPKEAKEVKSKKQKKCNNIEEEKKKKKVNEEEAPKGYIHVRARRGQATDSHSLAERVRREKISERMKTLQKLVPGCDKVTGKALMLDEIINYVQSLQNQVEFLSMKLASVNPMFYDYGMDLDGFIVRPERLNSSNIASSPTLQTVPQCNATQITAFANPTIINTTFNHHNNYPILDNTTATTASLLLQQGQQRPNAFSLQDNGSVLWDSEEQKQKFHNPSGFTNSLFSFH